MIFPPGEPPPPGRGNAFRPYRWSRFPPEAQRAGRSGRNRRRSASPAGAPRRSAAGSAPAGLQAHSPAPAARAPRSGRPPPRKASGTSRLRKQPSIQTPFPARETEKSTPPAVQHEKISPQGGDFILLSFCRKRKALPPEIPSRFLRQESRRISGGAALLVGTKSAFVGTPWRLSLLPLPCPSSSSPSQAP